MVTDNEIIEMLHSGMKKLLADCDAYEQKVLTVNLTNPRFREFRDLGLDIIRQCKSQLIIHMNLEDTQLVDINFGNDIAVGPLKPANLNRFAGFLAFFS